MSVWDPIEEAAEQAKKSPRYGKPNGHDYCPPGMRGDAYEGADDESPPPDPPPCRFCSDDVPDSRPCDVCGAGRRASTNGTAGQKDLRCKCGSGFITGLCPKCDAPNPLKPVGLATLLDTYREMRAVLIDGVLRIGETLNIIAPPKFGKSWFVMALVFAVATGGLWVGYQTVRGRVLYVDNELHPETFASRIRRIADAFGIPIADVEANIDVIVLRGRLQDITKLGLYLRTVPHGTYQLVVIDAMYRALPIGTDENDNAMIAGIYNMIDGIADHLGASFALIHHSSKGNQAQKSVTDVGSGAGSQSRAADTHMILRPHEEAGVFVLDGAVRSFPPIEPKCLRWHWPFFTVAEGYDPSLLQKPNARVKKAKADEPTDPVEAEPVWDAKRFADTFGTAEPVARSVILEAANQKGLSDRKASSLLTSALDREFLYVRKDGTKMRITNVPPAAEKPRRKRSKRPKK